MAIDTRFKKTAVALALSGAFAATSYAQTAPDADKPVMDLDRVVITGTATATSKIKQSVSVSTLDGEQITRFATPSASEVLRSVPGIRAESSGGEGNANVVIRGVPLSTGGARYVQFQEDGLPVVLFGDIAFGTADSFIKADGTVDRLEVIRGGSASALATNSPGGIVNFISKTGEDAGGGVGVSMGVGHKAYRVDFDYGNSISKDTRYFVGGYVRSGEGVRDTGVTTEEGGHVKANVTKTFDGGYVRASVKFLDDHAPTLLPVPVLTSNGNISAIPGVDPRTATFYSNNLNPDVVLTRNNQKVATNINDGLRVRGGAFGVEGALDVAGFKVENKFRVADYSGRFAGIFAADSGTVGTYTIASGANKGQTWTGRAFTAAVFNTSIDDLGSVTNDLKASKSFKLDNGQVTGAAGLFYSRQDVGLTWNFNHYLMQAVGTNAALLASKNTSTTVPGALALGTDVWGGCCNRYIDANYTTVSPYASIAYDAGALNIDASIRSDRQSAGGVFNQAVNQAYSSANDHKIDYSLSHTSYSLGANFRLNRDVAAFARVSDGVAFAADRLMFNGYELNSKTAIPINTIKQLEGGFKWRQGSTSAFVTFFNAKTNETNYEATTQKTTSRSYRSNGAELEAASRFGNFSLTGGLTYTDAKVTAAETPSIVGKKPRRQADFVYQLSPSYTMGNASIGVALVGTTKSWGDDDNTIRLPGYNVFNAYVNYAFTPKLSVNLSVNNLNNAIGYTEVEGDGHAARSINGRSVKAALRYTF